MELFLNIPIEIREYYIFNRIALDFLNVSRYYNRFALKNLKDDIRSYRCITKDAILDLISDENYRYLKILLETKILRKATVTKLLEKVIDSTAIEVILDVYDLKLEIKLCNQILRIACESCNKRLLMKIKGSNLDYNKVLRVAVKNGQLQIIRELLKLGADPTDKNYKAIVLAEVNENRGIVREFMLNKAVQKRQYKKKDLLNDKILYTKRRNDKKFDKRNFW